MKLLRDFFHLPAVGRFPLSGRREPMPRTVTVPAPLAPADNVVELHRSEAESQPSAAADEPPRYALAAGL
ncbi:hypothetical protein [Dyella sp. A6]|uniref:hypothetical protein n=1 Tax=Dyella aluminiiresistens TaxID=3069105 RepID=UPI002E770794|nr:hypothetical protein [Dyella sp. A6]